MRETFVEAKVTYTIEHDGQFFIVEHVPARVCNETGEQLFAPGTVERLHSLIKGDRKPVKLIETPVYEYA
ncbi:MAG: YgiT-type zinc finger protein [Planctomycetota bacterium]